MKQRNQLEAIFNDKLGQEMMGAQDEVMVERLREVVEARSSAAYN